MESSDHARRDARELVELLERARPIPLTNQLRFDRETVYELVGSIRAGAHTGDLGMQRLAEAADAVEEAVRNAMPVPLTDQVRIPRERVDALVQALRAVGA